MPFHLFDIGSCFPTSFGHVAAPGGEFLGGPAKYHMTDYYATWCPHCKALAPTWEAAKADFLKTHPGSELRWDEKQCAGDGGQRGLDEGACQDAGIQGFPTIRFSDDNHGQPGKLLAEFDGPRTKDSLIEFANKNLQMNELQRE
jgi:thiol-disulfide isomerase/thioredoxin